MLYGKPGVELFSTFEMLHQNVKVGLLLIRALFNVYMFSDIPNVGLWIVDCPL